MIIVRVPLRISFIGGGSDAPAFYEQFPGKVISAAINKYVFVAINEKFDDMFRIGYSITELVGKPHEVKNTRVRAALEHFGVERGLEIVSISDVPSSGSGLGASSSFSVALMHGLGEFLSKPYSDKYAVAEAACHLEMGMLGEKIGKQDQYAAAFGGMNVIDFSAKGVHVKPVRVSKKILADFNNHLIAFHIAGARDAATILSGVSHKLKNDKETFVAQKKLVDMVIPFKEALVKGEFKKLGTMLHKAWELKKKSHGISHTEVDAVYAAGKKAGAWGGKLLGAGGGGFVLFMAPPKAHAKIRAAQNGRKELPIGFDIEGSKIIFNSATTA